MVDPIGPKGSTPDRIAPVAPVAQTVKAAPVPTPASSTAAAAPAAGQLATQLSADAPVDTDRVARIKKAIADGTFPISPATIADRLIALRYDWVSHDAS